MPDLPLEEKMAYQAMACLYARYSLKKISLEQAREEKKAIWMECQRRAEARKFSDKLTARHVAVWKAGEAARAEYRKNRTLEAADKMLRVMEGEMS